MVQKIAITSNIPVFQGLRSGVSVLEIVFVGQCEVFVCLDFVEIYFSLGREAHRSANGVSILFKKCRFFRHLPS